MMARSERAEDSIGPVHSPRWRRCAVQICGHLPGIAVSAFLRAPLCPSWISSKLAKGSRIAPLHTPRRRQCAVQICGHLPGIAVSAFLRAPLCPSWISLKLAKGSRIAPLHTPRRRQCAVQICGHLPGIAVSAFLRAPLCPSWISSKLAKGSRIAPLHTPRRRQCAVQICGHLPGIAVSAFLRAPLCPSWISLKLAKGSRIAPLHTPRRRQCAVQICGHLPGIAVSAFLRAPLCPSWISSKLAKGSRIAPLSHPAPAAVPGPDLRSSPWDRRLRLPSCPFVSFVDILKAGKRKPHRPPFTPRAGGSARSRFAVISLGSPSPPSFVPLCVLRGYPQSWPKEAASPPFHTPRRRQCPVQICGHLPGIAVSAFLRAPLCPSWISSKLAKGSRIAPLSHPAPAAVPGPDLRSSPWDRRLRLPSCPFVSFVDILKAGKRKPHRPPFTPRAGGSARSRFAVISLGSPSPPSFVPLCVLRGYPQSWPKESASPPFHTPRRRQCPVQICGHLPGIAVSAFLRAPLCPSWISLKLAKGSRIAPLHTPPPFRAAPHPVLSRAIASELSQNTAMLPCPLPYPVQTP